MPNATAHEETIAGVSGVRFSTDAQPDTPEERKLQEIQRALSGDEVILPSHTTLPHLSLSQVKTVDGPSYPVITLWVATELRSEAARRLQAVGFAVHH